MKKNYIKIFEEDLDLDCYDNIKDEITEKKEE